MPKELSTLFKLYVDHIRSKFPGAEKSEQLFFNNDLKRPRTPHCLSVDCKELTGLAIQYLRTSFETALLKMQNDGSLDQKHADILSIACQHDFNVRDRHYRKPHMNDVFIFVNNAMSAFNKVLNSSKKWKFIFKFFFFFFFF